MSEFVVESTFGDYVIKVALGAAREVGSTAVALVDPRVADRVAIDPERMVLVEGNEDSKTLSRCEAVLVAMKNAGLTRGDTVAAVGGGVIQDVATLTSSLYMRGVAWVYVPTTLTAMADSCIGGKSSINVRGVKNLVGNFYPPTKILVDPTFVDSLPEQAIAAGLAEAVKICFARGADAFEQFLAMPAALNPGADEATVELIEHVLKTKRWFVVVDELDKAERQLLNFGHSFGHAWESACGFRVQHGIGVAAGVIAAVRHPRAARTDLTARLEKYCFELLGRALPEVRAALADTDWEQFRSALRSDKKNSRDTLRLVLPVEPASVRIVELGMNDEELMVAQEALRHALEEVAQ